MAAPSPNGTARAVSPSPVQVIAVTGGKGGVGKTTIAVNLAATLASRGKEVMLLDGDLGLANVDVFLGLTPRLTLADVLAGNCSLEEIVLDAPQGFKVVPAASGISEAAGRARPGGAPAGAAVSLRSAGAGWLAASLRFLVETPPGAGRA
jgi:flagellar biosynthesis protein FlhG